MQQALPDFVGPNDNVGFLDRHQERMLYRHYRKQGWFIGSGVVEAGCKNVVGKRLKQSGMFWSEPGATCVLNFHTLLAEQPIRLLLEKTATTPTSPKMMRSPWSLSHSREQFCRAPIAPKL